MKALPAEIGTAFIIEDVSELPRPGKIARLYADVETTSGDDKQEAFSPYYTDARACGWAVTWDDHPHAYYVPIRHRAPGSKNLPLAPVLEWLRELVSNAERWVNHNVKFDAHFLAADGVDFKCELECTTVMSKMLDTDRYGHRLKTLSREWLGLDMQDEVERDAYLKGIKSKDFGRVPVDMLGRYACMDVQSNRMLYHYLNKHLPADMDRILRIERLLTPVLFDMERRGVLVNKAETLVRTRTTYLEIIERSDELRALTGVEWVDHASCFFEILCNRGGLPVLAYTDDGNPSFDADALELYAGHPRVVTDEKLTKVLQVLQSLRASAHLASLFLEPFISLSERDGRLHCSFNQLVRTGRMSCSGPNLQQASKYATQLIMPGEGRAFGVADGSQMEFRLIVHYCAIQAAIEAYRNDPRTDFHGLTTQMMSRLIEGVDRDCGKQTNFMVSYGAGKRKITSTLMSNPAVMRMLPRGLGPNEYERLARNAATAIYEAYHTAMPEIKRTSNYATGLCKQRGYIRNKYGRRRHLPATHAHKAFNAMIQGCASDILKERMIATAPRYNKFYRDNDAHPVVNKHDEEVLDAPCEVMHDPTFQSRWKRDLEAVEVEFDVPILFDIGVSDTSWGDAKP